MMFHKICIYSVKAKLIFIVTNRFMRNKWYSCMVNIFKKIIQKQCCVTLCPDTDSMNVSLNERGNKISSRV